MACQHSNGHFILPDHPRLYLKVGDFATTPLQACTGTTSFPYKHLPCNKACSSTSVVVYNKTNSGRHPCHARGVSALAIKSDTRALHSQSRPIYTTPESPMLTHAFPRSCHWSRTASAAVRPGKQCCRRHGATQGACMVSL